jgi:hypothetical protein
VGDEQLSEVHSSPGSGKAQVDRWKESTSKAEYSGEDRWCLLVNRQSQSSLTISGFQRLEI